MGEQVITMLMMALRGLTIFPGMVLHFGINRPKSVAAVERAMTGDQKLFPVAQRHPGIIGSERGDLSQVRTVTAVKQLVKLPGKVVRVLVGGLERTELPRLEARGSTMMGEIATIEVEEDGLDSLTQETMLRILKDRLEEYRRVSPKITKEILPDLSIITDPNEMLNQIVTQLSWNYIIRQTVLGGSSLSARYEVVMHALLTEMEIYRVKKNFQEKVKADIDQNWKEYILREQVKVIHQKLGEDTVSDADEYQKKLGVPRADKEVEERLHKKIERFRSMPTGSQEANALHTYVETLLDLPRKKMSKDDGDIKHAEKIPNENHYRLEQVRERILEYPAVRTLVKKGTNPVICLVRPSGANKTSTARSVAGILNKKYVRISLGGIRGKVEIRGHRKVYMGAISGHIVEGTRQASVSNPLVFLDETDKASSDYKGDTPSVLLETPNREQNVRFRGYYVEFPADLPQILFIVTANTIQTILGPLLDCTGLIEVNGYTENEKFHIARDCLVSKQIERNGLKGSQIIFPDKSLEKIIHNYTREASVRDPGRRTGDVCYKTTRQLLEDKKKSIKVPESDLEKYLDKEKVTSKNTNEEDEIGTVCGLAWTSVGGDTLQTEVNVMPGEGSLPMIGQLGDVMKESTQIVLTHVRFVCPGYGITDDYFEKYDLHVHIPEGAVPKDGLSAGITMAIVMPSAMTGESVQAKVAMTGEITFRGWVLSIRGPKEKILATKAAHMERVPAPDKNRPNIAELPKEIIRGLDIVYIEAMEGVVSEVFVQSADRNQEKQI